MGVTLLLLLTAVGHAQNWEWAKIKSDVYYNHFNNLATDKTGNVYLPIPNLQSDSVNTNCSSVSALGFAVKYNGNGSCEWATATIGLAYDLVMDSFGCVYVLGTYADSIFITKLSSSGVPLWTLSTENHLNWSHTVGYSLTSDKYGNVYFTAPFRDSINIGSTSLSATSIYDNYVFAAIDSSGNWAWCKTVDGMPNSIAIDETLNIYMTGMLSDTAIFGTDTLRCSGNTDVFIAKYDNAGNAMWAKRSGSSLASPSHKDAGEAITVSKAGDVFVTGSFIDTSFFDNVTLISNGANDFFVAKYTPQGNLVWAKGYGSQSDDEGHSITTDESGNCYVGGRHVFFMSLDGIVVPWIGQYDLFVAKFDGSGTPQWAINAGGKKWNDVASGIGTYGNDIFVTGSLYDTAYFGLDTLYDDGYGSTFLAKLSGISGLSKSSMAQDALSIYPNPVREKLTLYLTTANAKASVYSIDGRRLSEEQELNEKVNYIDVDYLQPGIYLLIVTDLQQRMVRRFVKQ